MISGELFDSFDRNERRIVEIIDNDGAVATEKKLKHRVTSDVTSTAGHKNIPHYGAPRGDEEREREKKRIEREASLEIITNLVPELKRGVDKR